MSRRGAEERSWFSKNWGWCLPLSGCLGCLGLIALIAGIGTGGMVWLTQSLEIDDEALTRASTHPDVVAALGEPLEKSWSQNITIHSGDDGGELKMSFGVVGPKGEGEVRLLGVKRDDEWVLQRVEFRERDTHRWIEVYSDGTNKRFDDENGSTDSEETLSI